MLPAAKIRAKSALAACALTCSTLASADVRYEFNGWFLTSHGGPERSTLVYVAPDYITQTTQIPASQFLLTPQSDATFFEFLTPNASNPVSFDSVRIAYPNGGAMYEHFPLGSLSQAGSYTGLFLSTLSITAVPEPGSGILLALGIAGIALVRLGNRAH